MLCGRNVALLPSMNFEQLLDRATKGLCKKIPDFSADQLLVFWAKVKKGKPDECWEWCGSRSDKGYGVFCTKGEHYIASRVSLQLSLGTPLPLNMQACHKCDNPPCVNPAHLFLGTNDDNIADMVAKGRHARQLRTHCTKGHPFDSSNTGIRKTDGTRYCIACARATSKAAKLVDAAKLKKLKEGHVLIEEAVMREVWAALKLAELNYKRTNHDQPDLMGDDEHEAWGAILRALALLDGQTEKGGAE